MTPTLINLQNTPERNGIIAETVSFNSNSVTLKGTLYKPVVHDVSFSTVIVTGAWTTVKEQMAGTYARELANRGLAALAFDFTGWGESGGEPRYVEDPATKTADINAAVDYLAERDDVGAMYGLGICASSGYMATAVADNHKLEKLALVAPWLHNPKMAIDIYGGPETVASLIAATEAASVDPAVLIAASTTDDTAPMYQAPYYTETIRGLIPTYDNKFSPKGDVWIVAGHYHFRMVLQGDRWVVAAIKLVVFYQEGNLELFSLAQTRVATIPRQ